MADNGGLARVMGRFARGHSRASLEALVPDLATGVRAALATVVPLTLAAEIARPELAWTAIGGWLGTLADPGGSRGFRGRALLAFTVLGAVVVFGGESAASAPWATTALLPAIVFAMTMLRALAAAASTIGTMVAIMAAIATTKHGRDPSADALCFTAGGILAIVLSSIVWPVWTHLPVRRSLATVFRHLSTYAIAVDRCWSEGAAADDPRWVEIAGVYPRLIRDALEQARVMSLAIRERHAGESRMGSSLRLLVGLAESQFMLLASLSTEVEYAHDRSQGDRERAALGAVAKRYDAIAESLAATAWIPRPAAPLAQKRSVRGAIEEVSATLHEESAIALSLVGSLDSAAEGDRATQPGTSTVRDGISLDLELMRDALTRESPVFRHAVRTTLAAGVAAGVGTLLSPEHAPWVTVTTITVLQPFTGATVKRATERVIGTTLGSLVAAGVTATVESPHYLAALMFPLSIAAVVTRPRSYRLFTFFLTPLFVLIAMRYPGDFQTAVVRVVDTLVGGAIALAATFAIFPGWEERIGLPGAVETMVTAVTAYADRALATRVSAPPASTPPVSARNSAPPGAPSASDLRRAAAVAVSAAETSLERLLAEPLRHRGGEAEAMTQITYARRLALATASLETVASRAALDRAARVDAARARVQRFAELLQRSPTPTGER